MAHLFFAGSDELLIWDGQLDPATPREPIDLTWDDEGVIPRQLGPDTAFLFQRMTEDTLGALGAAQGKRVLDVGCGRGIDLASLADSAAILMGCDGSKVMVRKARATLNRRGLCARLVCCSAENLPFRTGTMDVVYCKGAIDHFYDPRKALEEMARVLRHDGRLVVSVANFESLSCRLGRTYNRLWKIFTGRQLPSPHFWEIPKDHVYRFHKAFLLRCLPRQVKRVDLWGISLLWGCPGWGALLRRLPHAARAGLLGVLDRVGRAFPSLADVMVMKARVDKENGKEGRGTSGIGAGEIMRNKSWIQGLVICLGTLLAGILFIIGLLMKSYWALAIPVAIGFLWLLGLAFWIGWTLMSIRVEPPKD